MKNKYKYIGTAAACNFYLKPLACDNDNAEEIISAQIKAGEKFVKNLLYQRKKPKPNKYETTPIPKT